jgi:hypothetical protein
VRPGVIGEHHGDRTLDVGQTRVAQLTPVAWTTLLFPSRSNTSTPRSAIAARSRALVCDRIRVRSGLSGISNAADGVCTNVVIKRAS